MSNNIDKLLEKSKIEDIIHIENSTAYKQSENKHFHRLRIIFIWVSGITLITIGVVIVWHLIGCKEYRWLSDIEITDLKNMATTGILGAVLGKFGNKLTE